MPLSRKAAGIFAGAVIAVSASSLVHLNAQQPGAARASETIVVDDSVTIQWIKKSDVAALREGVIDRMELKIGMPVEKGKPIGYLHDEIAKLTLAKSKLQSEVKGAGLEAKAKKDLALAVVAINKRLTDKNPGMVSVEERAKAEAELNVAEAQLVSALERRAIDTAEAKMAERMVEEHIIRAPFDGIIIERMKNEGESVRSNEPVVQLGDLDRLRAEFYVQREYASRVKVGMRCEFSPRTGDNPRVANGPIDSHKFVGTISFVDPRLQAVAESAKRIYAEFDNKEHELEPGMKGVLTIYVNDVGTVASGDSAQAPALGARPVPLPPLPR